MSFFCGIRPGRSSRLFVHFEPRFVYVMREGSLMHVVCLCGIPVNMRPKGHTRGVRRGTRRGTRKGTPEGARKQAQTIS
eukprot:2563131-Alexandrium_andersonii.AAC.1